MTRRFASLEVSGNSSRITEHATVYSPALGRRADVSAIATTSHGQVHTIVLLHGVYGSHWVWDRLGGAGRAALRFTDTTGVPLMVVMPSDGLWGVGSGYTTRASERADAWILDDIPSLVERWYPDLECSAWSIAGLSMGGYGGLSCGTDDALLPGVLKLSARLRAAGVRHETNTFRGGHDWAFWTKMFEYDLQFLCQAET